MAVAMPPASAEIKRNFDQFSNTFTISSTKTVNVTDTLSITAIATKMFSPKLEKYTPTYINFIIIDNKYHFFTKSAYYLVDGDPHGQEFIWHTRDHGLPDKRLLHTSAMRTIYKDDNFHKAIKNGKTMQIKLQFSNQQPMIVPITIETLKEWADVFAFDLDAEIKKLPK
jgi:hypothetical protein